jgi:hypothetical protein
MVNATLNLATGSANPLNLCLDLARVRRMRRCVNRTHGSTYQLNSILLPLATGRLRPNSARGTVAEALINS